MRWTLPVLMVCALALGLRLAVVPRQGLWTDEFFSLAMATGHSLEHPAAVARPELGDFVERPGPVPVAEYARGLAVDEGLGVAGVTRAVSLSDTSPPLYYVLLAGWVRVLGTSDWALRGFSVLCALLALPFLAALARRAGGRAAVVPALLLTAVSPLAVFYGTEGRMYALLWLWVAVGLWTTERLHRRGTSAGRLLGWALVGAAGLLTHYFFAFLWAAAGLWLLLEPGRAARLRVVAGAALTGLLVLPWYLQLPQSLAQWRVTQGWLEVRPGGYDALSATLLAPWSYFSVRGVWGVGSRWDHLFALLCAGVVAAALIALVMRRARGQRTGLSTPTLHLLALGALLPWLGVVVFDLWRETYAVVHARYLGAGLPAALLLAGWAVSRLRPPLLRHAALGALVLGSLVGVQRIARNDARNGQQYRELAAHLAERAAPGDLVLVHSIPSGVVGLARYLEQAGVDPEVGYAAWVGQLGQRRAPDDLLALAAGAPRVHLVSIHTVGDPPVARDWLEAHARRVDRFTREAGEVRTYAPGAGEGRWRARLLQGQRP